MRILLIDDSKSSLVALQQAIAGFAAQIEAFSDPVEAIRRAQEAHFDLVVTDFMMPRINGLAVIKKLRKLQGQSDLPAIVVTSQTDQDLHLAVLGATATDILTKPFDPQELQARVKNLLSVRQAQKDLQSENVSLKETAVAAEQRSKAYSQEIVWCLARAMGSRDGSTGNHVERVAMIARLIAEGFGLADDVCDLIFLAAPLHDIGKIGIPDRILQKPGKLDPDEIARMREHVSIGVEILSDSTAPVAVLARSIIGGHHEKWDGSGYPYGVKGTAIPIEARIVAVADVLDALCSERPYKRAWSPEAAYQEIIDFSGRHFDPACVEALQRKWTEVIPLLSGSEGGQRPEPSTPHELVPA
jgi:putative two-component system response regulator